MTETTPTAPVAEPNCRPLSPAEIAARTGAGGRPIPHAFLRCFRGADGRLTAGVHPAANPTAADNWDDA